MFAPMRASPAVAAAAPGVTVLLLQRSTILLCERKLFFLPFLFLSYRPNQSEVLSQSEQ